MNNNHPLATGLIAGAALGVGMGLLLAPRRGSETRTQLKGHVNRYAGGISKGYRTTREKVAQGARETGRYVRDVADVVTRKARHGDAQSGRGPVSAVMGTAGQARDTKHRVG
jgi:gas vesicle protein